MNTKIIISVDQSINSEELALDAIKDKINKLYESGAINAKLDDVLIDFDVDNNAGYAIAELKEGALVDAAKLNEVGAGLYENPIDNGQEAPDSFEQLKTFSAAMIQERLRLAQRNPKLRLRYMIMDYKRYWKSKQSQIKKDPKIAEDLYKMFLTDMSGLMMQILPFIAEGKQLNTLIGVTQVAPNLSKTARDLSLIYKRALKSDKSSGTIPKSIFSQLKTVYNDFMRSLLTVVFPGIEEVVANKDENSEVVENVTKATSKTYSYGVDGRIKLFG